MRHFDRGQSKQPFSWRGSEASSPVRLRREEFNNPWVNFVWLFQMQEMSKPRIDFFFQALGEQMVHGVECRKTAWPVSCAMQGKRRNRGGGGHLFLEGL